MATVDFTRGRIGSKYSICLGIAGENGTFHWMSDGRDDQFKMIDLATRKANPIPLPVRVGILVILMLLSGLFSGLNLGLMSLDATELELIMKCGSPKEQEYAKTIYPVRRHGNYLLCTLLIGNTLVNVFATLLLDSIAGALISAVVTPLLIVLFGEIVPQSLCSKYGLSVGAYSIWITRFFMVLTFPLSWPIAKILDKLIGHDVHRIYDKDRLLELIRISENHGTLKDSQEVKIVKGALELSRKVAKDVMTPIMDVFMIADNATLDTQTIATILKSGYTRIPVHKGEGQDREIVGLLNVKNLALLDPDDCVAVRTVCNFYKHPVKRIREQMPLMYLLGEFRKGGFHMAFVERDERGILEALSKEAAVTKEGTTSDDAGTSQRRKPRKPASKELILSIDEKVAVSEVSMGQLVGLVTLEDIIEEILQAEIIDETDMVMDNVGRAPRLNATVEDIEGLIGPQAFFQRRQVSSQLCFGAYQYLSASVEEFGPDFITAANLQTLIRENAVHHRARDRTAAARYIYRANVAADYFTLILEGHVQVQISAGEGFVFDAGPFFIFGKSLIKRAAWLRQRTAGDGSVKDNISNLNFIPDFTAEVTGDVTFLCITARAYFAAARSHPAKRVARRQKSDSKMGGTSKKTRLKL